MAFPLQLEIKESIKELRSYQHKGGELIAKRMAVLIEIKKAGAGGISKRALSDLTGVNHNSIVKWRNQYLAGGIEMLLHHGRIGFKPSVVSPKEHKQLAKILNNPNNGIQSYAELLQWVKNELQKDMKYITLVKYVQRHFETKIKVVRKAPVKNDLEAAEALKKP